MASKGMNMCLVLVLVVMFSGGAMAQSGCTSALLGLSSCLNYITGNSSKPSSSCCSQLGNVVQAQPQCLCSVLNGGGSSLGITINQTQALTLPGACKVQTPPLSQCNTANGPTTPSTTPASSPAYSPSDSSDGTPETPDTPSDSDVPSGGSGSKTVPSTDGNTSDGSNNKAPLHLVLAVLFIASFASTATRF